MHRFARPASRRQLVGAAVVLPFALVPAVALSAPPPPQLRPVGGPTRPPAARPTAAPAAPAPTATPLAADRWLQNHVATALWSDAAAGRVLAQLGQWSYLRLTGRQAELRLPVVDVATGARGWVDADALGPVEAPPPPRVDSLPSGEWIGINRTAQLVVAYRDAQPQFWARTSTGRPGWETPLGAFTILRRVASETMDSSTLLGRDAERASYKIERVGWTQYFTADGNALHENWWKEQDTFGLPTSHGCAGLRPEDAGRFWDFASVGMPVLVHP